jgi:hypothetical protein
MTVLLLTSVATLFFEPAISCLEDIADLYLSVGVFAKQLWKTTVIFFMFVLRSCVRLEQTGFRLTDIRENVHWVVD